MNSRKKDSVIGVKPAEEKIKFSDLVKIIKKYQWPFLACFFAVLFISFSYEEFYILITTGSYEQFFTSLFLFKIILNIIFTIILGFLEAYSIKRVCKVENSYPFFQQLNIEKYKNCVAKKNNKSKILVITCYPHDLNDD